MPDNEITDIKKSRPHSASSTHDCLPLITNEISYDLHFQNAQDLLDVEAGARELRVHVFNLMMSPESYSKLLNRLFRVLSLFVEGFWLAVDASNETETARAVIVLVSSSLAIILLLVFLLYTGLMNQEHRRLLPGRTVWILMSIVTAAVFLSIISERTREHHRPLV